MDVCAKKKPVFAQQNGISADITTVRKLATTGTTLF
jgi:hypothetical protein